MFVNLDRTSIRLPKLSSRKQIYRYRSPEPIIVRTPVNNATSMLHGGRSQGIAFVSVLAVCWSSTALPTLFFYFDEDDDDDAWVCSKVF